MRFENRLQQHIDNKLISNEIHVISCTMIYCLQQHIDNKLISNEIYVISCTMIY
jgi:hypothetical protein